MIALPYQNLLEMLETLFGDMLVKSLSEISFIHFCLLL